MKVALVHDYLNEYGGAERVLEALAEMYPDAPIYTAFYRPGSQAYERFTDRQIIASWAQKIPGFAGKLHSPLRFLAPLIWESFNLDDYDVVISSASWYITKGVITRPETVHICYCHTPPRYLYGYDTSIAWRKYGLVRLYAGVVNKRMREYDFLAAQRVDYFVANSENVQRRIEKFYRRESEVIYPPVEIKETPLSSGSSPHTRNQRDDKAALNSLAAMSNTSGSGRGSDYYLVISRLVGGKGLDMAVGAANQLKLPLKVVGTGAGWSREEQKLKAVAGPTVEFLGYVKNEKLAELYAGAKAFLALARDEDFGITPVEAMMAGTPVVAYNGGGYKETVVEGKTGVFFFEYSVEALKAMWREFDVSKYRTLDERVIRKHAQKFGKKRFIKEMGELVEEKWGEKQRDLRF